MGLSKAKINPEIKFNTIFCIPKPIPTPKAPIIKPNLLKSIPAADDPTYTPILTNIILNISEIAGVVPLGKALIIQSSLKIIAINFATISVIINMPINDKIPPKEIVISPTSHSRSINSLSLLTIKSSIPNPFKVNNNQTIIPDQLRIGCILFSVIPIKLVKA